jgi:magnesium-transporting ATPase (P-type)
MNDLSTIEDVEQLDINDSSHLESILFGGTILLIHNAAMKIRFDVVSIISPLCMHFPPADDGIFGIFISAGFETTQGYLLRAMVLTISSNTTTSHNTSDIFIFILLLFCSSVIILLFYLRTRLVIGTVRIAVLYEPG